MFPHSHDLLPYLIPIPDYPSHHHPSTRRHPPLLLPAQRQAHSLDLVSPEIKLDMHLVAVIKLRRRVDLEVFNMILEDIDNLSFLYGRPGATSPISENYTTIKRVILTSLASLSRVHHTAQRYVG